MATTLRGYQEGDEAAMTPRPDFAAAFEAEGRRLPAGPKWTMMSAAGRVLGIGGLEPLGDQTWAAWAFMADLRPRDWLRVTTFARDILGHQRIAYRARKIQAVAAPVKGACRLLERIGFKRRAGPVFDLEET